MKQFIGLCVGLVVSSGAFASVVSYQCTDEKFPSFHVSIT